MGTRNLSLLKLNNVLVLAQYGQWDGYPSGQGVTILEFCKENNIKKIRQIASDIKNIKDFEKWDEYAKYYDNAVSKGQLTLKDEYYFKNFLCRDICGDIFENVINLDKDMLPEIFNKTLYVRHYEDLIDTENYCDTWIEYAYLINLDTNELECYGYGSLLKKYPLDKLPSKDLFVSELTAIENEE